MELDLGESNERNLIPEILMALASERKLIAIADDLSISEYTLRNHLAAICQKLGLLSRLELYVVCNHVDTAQI